MLQVLHRVQQMPEPAARDCLLGASKHPAADPAVEYPDWYLKRWHCLPEGYLSGRSAWLYDQTFRRVYAGFQEQRVFEALRDAVPSQGSPSMLELGCGTGRLLASVRSKLPWVRAWGVDLSPFMVESSARRAGLPTLPGDSGPAVGEGVVHADARALRWRDASFDVIAAAHLLGHMPAEAAAETIVEIERLLRPGGRVVLAEHAWHRLPLGRLRLERDDRVAAGMIRLFTLVAE